MTRRYNAGLDQAAMRVTHYMWRALGNARRNKELRVQMIMSSIFHLLGVHEWGSVRFCSFPLSPLSRANL